MPEMLRFRVSEVDMFSEWREDEEKDMSWIFRVLHHHEPTDDMLRGTAFHAALEQLNEGETDRIDSQGFTFLFDGDFYVPAFKIKEVRTVKNYGGIEVTGCCDAIQGTHIIDHKAATWFDAERYFSKYQWRYYLDLFKADRFTWYVWQMKEADDPHTFLVTDLHKLEQYRYPNMEQDCRDLAQELKEFAETHLVQQQGFTDRPQTYNTAASIADIFRQKKEEAGSLNQMVP